MSGFDLSLGQAWAERFGIQPEGIPERLDSFLNHRSVRKYTGEDIPETHIEGLVAAAQSTATSSNLQSWSVVSVQDPASRAEISRMAGNQKQILTCSWFFAFIADLNRAKQLCEKAGEPGSGLDTIELYTVAIIDAALAAERFVCAAEALGYGICYIGSLRNDPQGIKELLNLPDYTIGAFGLCLGVPDRDAGESIKPRLSQDKVWFREQYVPVTETDEYDERAGIFFGSQGMAINEPWSLKTAKRVNLESLNGRESLLGWLNSQGLARR